MNIIGKPSFYSRCGSASLYPSEPSRLPVVVAQPDKRQTNRTVLCWSGMADTEHNDSYEQRGESFH